MTANLAKSVHQRLLNLAKQRGQRFNDLLQHYALERWLYRLSKSVHRDRFVLKGALMLVAWNLPRSRPTRDIDMLARADNDLNHIHQLVAEICRTTVEDDGLQFDAHSVQTERIAEDALYEGVRATFPGLLGNAKAPMQIDLGFSDVITPGPTAIVYPSLIDMPRAELMAYNPETAIAEKFEAMVKLGELNSRMKDFFDIWTLSQSRAFVGAELRAAIISTFEHRGTTLNAGAVCFSSNFAALPSKQSQWAAFLKRSGLTSDAPGQFQDVCAAVMTFLQPMLEAPADTLQWPSAGPWASV
ncbi:MAG: nucleotidyl transferase AbiEii/AbiGii toxin family protein [Planctomycetota bacterium]|nr:MAG: nucleotidyl transferase AbiEii/AbiGii toxin family protein [Planctomycetota bacterium]